VGSSRRGDEERAIESTAHRRRTAISRGVSATISLIAAALCAVASICSLMGSPVARAARSAATHAGIVTAWGFNEDGELGNGTTEGSNLPVAVSGLRGVMAIAAGGNHSLALLSDGTVMAWGDNSYGQLGDGSSKSGHVPVAVRGLSEATAVAAGEFHSLALLRNGTVMAWGRNSSGQLGDGSHISSEVPVPVSNLRTVAAISAGGSFSLGLLKDGTVVAWGDNSYGELGAGGLESSSIPVAVRGTTGVTAISAGSRHSLALLADGTVEAWGANAYGQLGDGTETPRSLPAAVSELSRVTAVSAGNSQSLAVIAGGAVVAWGDNDRGQLGNGSHAGPERCGAPPVIACSKVPVPVRGLSEVAAISAGGHNLALLQGGTVMAWGPNNVGQLGDGLATGPEACGPAATACSTIPVLSLTHGVATSISAGGVFSLALGPESPGPPPELGRCVRVATSGGYRNGRCTSLSRRHKGHFEWLAGPGANPAFTERLYAPQLETVGRRQLRCGAALLEGQYTGPKVETISRLKFEGCRDVTSNTSCQTSPTEEGVIAATLPLDGHLGSINAAAPSIGWEIMPKPPASSLVTFYCGSAMGGNSLTLEGTVIGQVTPINSTRSTFGVLFTQRRGQQVPEFLDGDPRSVLMLSSTPPTREGLSEQVGLSSRGLSVGGEPIEFRAPP
jgi:alpha-tubulin suppressor-like RCC1 family protein